VNWFDQFVNKARVRVLVEGRTEPVVGKFVKQGPAYGILPEHSGTVFFDPVRIVTLEVVG